MNLDVFFFQFILGILTSLSPCLFPLMPTYFALIAAENETSQSKLLLSLIGLTAGIMIVYSTIGLLVNSFLSLIGFFLQNYVTFATVQGALLILAGIMLVYTPKILYSIQLPQFLNDLLYSKRVSGNLLILGFVVGLLYTIIAAPCAISYFFVSWGQLLNLGLSDKIIGYSGFSLGAAFPFLLIVLLVPEFKQTFAAKISKNQEKIKTVLGIIVLISGFYLILSTYIPELRIYY